MTGGGGVTLVLGGARSGKSRYAESLITAQPQPWVYVATAQVRDDEMAARIKEHKARRAAGWQTIEAPHEVPEALNAAPQGAAILVDCLTLWLSNLMHAKFDIDKMTVLLEQALAARSGATVLVSNEVGLGIVPENALGREFRDRQGVLNQRLAAVADRVVFMIAGLPNVVKERP
ncbi:bifunctional adenosylcobinamide kinase/adenosylcobinamide-phosphate guanylyltransferase [Methyloceanibacter sp.]|uniref:bifunctional adenosylcobinamide kinase/adenosylcobinamide-phosphate guanylyltransferase n=1 Tax=Methyloceanibacter sp. TaxID=1965321 RepID=UPI003D6D239E